MASRGGSDLPTFEGRLHNCPVGVKRAGEKLFNCFKNPKIGVIDVQGFYGVGGWRIVEYAAQKAKESHLFDVQIPVKVLQRDFSLTKVQMEIALQLGLTAAGSTEDEETLKFLEVGHEIYDLLRGRRFLLMIGYVSEGTIDMESMGVPFRRSRTYDSKVVYVGFWEDDSVSNVAIKLEESSMDLLREEATSIAHSPNVKGCYAPDTVLNCFFYLMLFREEGCEVEWLTRYWMAEGFITRGGMEEDEDWRIQQKVEALLRELEDHFMAYCRSNKWRLSSRIRMASRDLKSSSTHDRFWSESPLPIEIREWENIHRMNVLVWEKETYLPPPAPNCPKLSTLIFTVISCSGSRKIIIPDPFFEQMQGLRVLVLYQLGNRFLPPSVSCLHNLRLLIIEGWENLESLPSSFQALHKLEFLEVSKSHSLESIPYEFFIQMNNLRFLSLDGKKIRSLPSSVSKLCTLHELKLTSSDSLMELPDESFECMQRLRVLDLSNSSNLKSLPSSLLKMFNLRRLVLANCYSLKIKLLPHLQKLTALEELILCNCNSLEDIDDVSSSLGNILPKLRMLDVSGIKTFQRLSLRGIQSLEFINLAGLTNLQVLSLSGTRLQKFPEKMHQTDHLRRLDMQCMDHILEINWDGMSIELEELNINQCGALHLSTDNEWPRNRSGAQIWLGNSKLLQSFMPSSELWRAKCFSQFHIRISPCQVDQRGRGKGIHLHQGRKFLYKYINSKAQTCDIPFSARHFNRHLDICGGSSSPNGIDGVLSHTELFTLCDNAFVRRLSDLGDVNRMTELKECRVEKCKQMEKFFEGENASSDTLSLLENIWMSNLARLKSICEGTYGSRSFELLKHIYLDCCPRLITVFSSSASLPSLEKLEIMFCSRLEAVFRKDATMQGSLQRLHTVRLWELPKLESICHSTYLSALKKLRVRGCRNLKMLPLCVGDNAFASTSIGGGDGCAEVEGELKWWDCLKWEKDSIKHHIHFKESRPFTRR